MLKIGIIRERKNTPDERVAFSPKDCAKLKASQNIDLKVEKSEIRRFKNEEYKKRGIKMTTDLSDREVLFGVKEVPIDALMPNKSYFFFSHTIKKQAYNKALLKAILEKNITLLDYECLTDEKGMRLVAFGRYAGIVGCYNGLYAFGKKTKKFDLKRAFQCADRGEMERELKKVKLGRAKLVLTGRGRVAGGALEILKKLRIKQVSPQEFLEQQFETTVFTQLAVTDYNKRKDGSSGSMKEFFTQPDLYESDFMRFAEVADIYVACHFWKDGSPFIFSREDAKSSKFKIGTIADISCDIDGPVASTLRPSTIADPLYGYDPKTEMETEIDNIGAITVMAVDNLPCELPRDSSSEFGADLIREVLPSLFNGDKDGILKRASIAKEGSLTERYSYLKDWVEA